MEKLICTKERNKSDIHDKNHVIVWIIGKNHKKIQTIENKQNNLFGNCFVARSH